MYECAIISRYSDPNYDLRVYSKKDVRRMPSAPVLPSRDIFRRSNRNNNGIVASESGKYIGFLRLCIICRCLYPYFFEKNLYIQVT